jgi:hypothetical protein
MKDVMERVEHIAGGMLNLDSDPVKSKKAIEQVLEQLEVA